MKAFSTTLPLLAALCPIISAFNILHGRLDGVYHAKLDSSGKLIGDIVSLNKTTSNSRRSVHRKRQLFPNPLEIGCTGISMNSDDEHSAWEKLGEWCDDGVNIGGGWVAIAWTQSYNAVWYCCVYQGYQGCSSAELTEAGDDFYDTCHTTTESAYVWISGWQKTYGRTNVGESACTVTIPAGGTEKLRRN